MVRWHHGLNVHYRSVTKSCPALWDPMNYSMPGFSVLHCLLEFTQTVHDAIIFSGSIHVSVCVSALLFSMVIILIPHLFIHSPVVVYWICFYLFFVAVMNEAAMNIYVQVCMNTHSTYVECIHRREIAGSIVMMVNFMCLLD